MNLYLVTRKKQKNQSGYNSFVCAAISEYEARTMFAGSNDVTPGWKVMYLYSRSVGKSGWYSRKNGHRSFRVPGTWPAPQDVKVKQIGTTNETKSRVILADFS